MNDLFEYLSDEEMVKNEPYKIKNRKETEESLKWRISTDEMVAVALKSTNKMIGNVYLGKRDFESIELGYVFNKKYWNQGYAKESCDALIKKLFSQGIHRIFTVCDPNNIASWKLFESLSFKREGYLKQNVYFWKDTYVYYFLAK